MRWGLTWHAWRQVRRCCIIPLLFSCLHQHSGCMTAHPPPHPPRLPPAPLMADNRIIAAAGLLRGATAPQGCETRAITHDWCRLVAATRWNAIPVWNLLRRCLVHQVAEVMSSRSKITELSRLRLTCLIYTQNKKHPAFNFFFKIHPFSALIKQRVTRCITWRNTTMTSELT